MSLGFHTLRCQFWCGHLGVSALGCSMVKFLCQTSALLWLKHQSAYIQHFLPHHIQPGQTVQWCFEHPCSTDSQYVSGNVVFPLVLLFYYINFPFKVFWTWTDTVALNQRVLSSVCHLLPWPVTNLYTMRSRAGQAPCSNFPITSSQLLTCLHSQSIQC